MKRLLTAFMVLGVLVSCAGSASACCLWPFGGWWGAGYGGGYGDGDGYGDGGGEFPALGVAGGHVPPIWAPPPPPPGAPPPMNQPMRGYDAPPYGSDDRVDEAPPLRFGNFQQLGSGYRPGPR